MKKNLALLAGISLWCMQLATPVLAQVEEKAVIKATPRGHVLTDDYPIIVPTNDRRVLRAMKNAEGTTTDFVTNGGQWNHCNLTYYFVNGTPDMYNGGVTPVIQALNMWAAQTSLTFTQVTSPSQADITIQWAYGSHGDSQSFDGRGGVLAHAGFPAPANTYGVPAGSVHFDESEDWTDAPQSRVAQPFDVLSVALHEIGHALGLAHSNTQGAIMQPYYDSYYRQRALGSDDIAGIQSIYGPHIANTLTGPGVLCSGSATYSVDGASSASWTSSNPSAATINSTTGVATVTGSGYTTFTARVATGCGPVFVTKDVIVNTVPPAIGLVQYRHDDCKRIEQYRINNYNSDVTYTLTTSDLSSLSSLTGNYLFIKGNNYSPSGYFTITATACGQSTSVDGWVEWYSCDAVSTPTDAFSQPTTTAYPNPAAESLTLPAEAKQAVLTNSQGNPVQQLNKAGNIDVRNLPNGLYNLRMQVDGKTVNQRIQVQH